MADLELTDSEFSALAARLDEIAEDAATASDTEAALNSAATAIPGATAVASMSKAGKGLDDRLHKLVSRLEGFSLEAVLAEQDLHTSDAAGQQRFTAVGPHVMRME